VEVRDLAQRVHPRVRATRALHRDHGVEQRREAVLQRRVLGAHRTRKLARAKPIVKLTSRAVARIVAIMEYS
jgi:hypothetical protein